MSSEDAEQSPESSPAEEEEGKEVQAEKVANAEATDESIVVAAEAEEKHEEEQTEEAGEEQTDDGAQDAEEESQGPRKLTIDDIQTAPMDFRFPTTNQARHCFTRYIEYHKCVRDKGEEASECNKYAKYYRSLCPGEWIERWNEQRENGTFPGPI